MSSAAIARKRRAETSQTSTPNNGIQYNANDQNASKQQSGLTLPQVIHVIDNRLNLLETFMKETKTTTQSSNLISTKSVSFDNANVLSTPILDDFQNRFEILATEIADLKDIVLKLQSYTMDINKTLLEERIHLMSDMTGLSDSTTLSIPITIPVSESITEDSNIV
jgi:hypothetical protein